MVQWYVAWSWGLRAPWHCSEFDLNPIVRMTNTFVGESADDLCCYHYPEDSRTGGVANDYLSSDVVRQNQMQSMSKMAEPTSDHVAKRSRTMRRLERLNRRCPGRHHTPFWFCVDSGANMHVCKHISLANGNYVLKQLRMGRCLID